MAELFSDVLKGARQTQNTLAAEDELMSTINTAEDNMIEMVNMVLDKRTSDENPTPVAITTTEVSVLAIKAKGGKLPEHFLTEIGGLSLPFFETFQDRSRKKEIVIIVFAYKRSPYLYVTNPESIGNGSSVVKVIILEKEKEKEKEKDILKIEDEDDPLEVTLSNEKLELANELVSMTESSTDSGIFMSYVDTTVPANEFLIEIKLKSLKICDIFGKYETFPDQSDYDLYVKTKGRSRIIYRDPLKLKASYYKQSLKITLLSNPTNRYMKPLVVTASCEDDRYDGNTRKKRSISLVTHKFRTSYVSSSTLFKTFENWTANERKEDLRTSDNQIKFKSNFLGAFSADVFFIPPSDIDFSKIFATFTTSLVDSPYALAAIITMLVIGSLLTIKLRWLDISDKIMWEFLPLKDNPYDFSVVYFVTIETSVNSSREMKSSVFLNIIGQNGFSGTRKMDDGIRKNFKNGTTSHFTMKLEEDVGHIQKIQIWHDNTDGHTEWHLRKVSIIKANTLQRYTFLCGRVLSLKSENGRIWSSLNVFNEDVVETDTLFYNISRRKLFDDYLWVSLVKRPQFSRFTRVQRLWCLTTILFLSMVSSAMWYDIPDDETTQSIILGPLKLNFKQFYVGLMSGLVALIPSIVLVLIFRKRKFQGEVCQGCYIPWWFIFIAYALIVLCVVISGTFVFLYSLQWGGDKTLEWMISFLLSVCQSVLILEPLKAIMIAAVIACVFKRVGSKELCDLSTPIPSGDNFSNANSGQDVHMEVSTKNDHNRAEYPLFPGNQNETKEQILFRKTVQLDKRLWAKTRTWIGIFLYVTLIAAICSHNDVSSAYLQNEHILNTLSTINTPNSSSEISDFIKTTFSRAVYPKWWETENDELLRPAYIQRFLLNAYNYRLTLTRLRQLRVKGNCTGPAITQDTIRRCVPSYSEETEETANFCPFWGDFNESDCFDENEEFHYSFLNSRFDDLDPAGDLIFVGEHGTYGPGGYYIDLGPKQSLVSKYLDELIEHDWIDYRTRVLFLDLVTYNANSRLFSQIKLVFELPTTGSITLTKHVWSASFYPYQSSLDFVVLVLQIIFVLVLCVRFVLFLVYLIRCRMNAFLIVHTYSKFLELFFGAVAIICYILRIDATISVITSLRESVGRYISFEKVYQFDAAYQGSLAMLLFIIILDLLSPLEFNYHFFTMVSSLKIARGAIVAFMVIIILELTAFASLIWLTIGRKHEMFKNMFETMNTLLTVLLSMRKYNTEAFDDLLVKFYFGLYTFSLTITLVNVFISLLTISLNDVKRDLDKGVLQFDQDLNKHLWVKFNKFIQWIKDKLCFPEIREKEDGKLKECIEKLCSATSKMEKREVENHKILGRLMIKLIQWKKWKVQLDCLNVDRQRFATKYVFGYKRSGETLIILTVPFLSYSNVIDLTCFIIPCSKQNIDRRIKDGKFENSFMFVLRENINLQGSVLVDILNLSEFSSTSFNAVMTKQDIEDWKIHAACYVQSGIQVTLRNIPHTFAAIQTGQKFSDYGWRPFETYITSRNGESVYLSYDLETKIVFEESCFPQCLSVSMRTRQGPSTTIVNVDIDEGIQTRSEIHLPLSNVKGTDGDHSHLAHYIIVGRESSDKEWEKINSTLKTTENGFRFAFNKPWSVFEVTVKESKIHWIQKYRHNSYFDIPLVKAIVMISQIKEVARKWKQIANMLGMIDTDMFTSEDEVLCQEEKCFMVLEKWLQQSTVTFRMLISLLCSLNLKAIADQIEQKWKTDIFPEQCRSNDSNDNDNGTVLANPDKDVTGNQRMKEFIYQNN
ncbi:polycystic kidney disease protein 1-like 2 [Mytilus californianus]|uniref:polycystic kidney disease protein 1-like 2 n=1 Tax=Mytilus californianus TaxID=6549 RepID=UPI00224803AD|nr:polycystic kidney disease protein 1-like 2 [Mytilus californianus]